MMPQRVQTMRGPNAASSYAAKQATSLIPIVVFAVQDLAGRSSFQAGGTPWPGGSTKLSFSLSPVPRSGCGIFVLENMRTRRRSRSASNSAMPMCVEYCGSAIWHPIIEAIIEGRQPRFLTVKRLLRGIPCAWADQRAAFGFAS
jgi:hypothetical protein